MIVIKSISFILCNFCISLILFSPISYAQTWDEWDELCSERIKWKQKKKAKQLAECWIEAHADSLGLPAFEPEKIYCSPDEGVLEDAYLLEKSKDTLSETEIQHYSKQINGGELYTSRNNLEMDDKSLSVSFGFTRDIKLLRVLFYKGEDMIYEKYYDPDSYGSCW